VGVPNEKILWREKRGASICQLEQAKTVSHKGLKPKARGGPVSSQREGWRKNVGHAAGYREEGKKKKDDRLVDATKKKGENGLIDSHAKEKGQLRHRLGGKKTAWPYLAKCKKVTLKKAVGKKEKKKTSAPALFWKETLRDAKKRCSGPRMRASGKRNEPSRRKTDVSQTRKIWLWDGFRGGG